MVDLGTLGGFSQPYAINASGQIVGYSTDANGIGHAVLWNPGGGIKDLGTLPGFTHSNALFINDAGHIAGYALSLNASNFVQSERSFFYTESTGMRDIGSFGGAIAHPKELTESGQMVGFSLTPTNNYTDEQAYTWTQTGGLVDQKQDVLVYDNQINSGGDGTLSEGTAIGAGNVVIHTSSN
jgi:probable HAF family extracellular repeat protein